MSNEFATEPQPPSLHWAIVLVLSIVTLGIFAFVWAYRQASFVKKIDGKNNATLLIAASGLLFLFANLMSFVNAMTIARGGQATHFGPLGTVLGMFELLFFFSAFFQMQKSITARYGVPLNGVLTFLFNVYYLQYHLTRIASARSNGSSNSGINLQPNAGQPLNPFTR